MKNSLPTDRFGSRLFLTLIIISSFFLITILGVLWLIATIGLQNMPPIISWTIGFIFCLFTCFIFWLAASLILSIIFPQSIFFSKRIHGLSIKLFLPFMIFWGRFIGFSKSQIRSSFIQVNNKLTLNARYRFLPEKILLLMPHCLQNSLCTFRLTYDVNNCKRCGKCCIAGLLKLSEQYGVKLVIATGGTIARKIISECKPELIIAVACERDLTSGIQDAFPIPVLGILNERPLGPCIDTTVSLMQVEMALQQFTIKNSQKKE